MKTLGLIGGMSWESTALYYKLINEGVRARMGGMHSAPLMIWSCDFAPISHAQHEGRWDEIVAQLAGAARRLEASGADGIILCTNTMHLVADQIQAEISIPFLHIADAIVERARSIGISRLGLLGTKFTMEMPFLKERLARAGFKVSIPEAPMRREIHRIIYDELCAGEIFESSRASYLYAIEALSEGGAQAAILGCTEIGLLVQQQHSGLPLLDTTILHAELAIDFICEGSPWQVQETPL